MEIFLSKQANSILDTFDTVLAYLREHLDLVDAQHLHAAYGNASALEIMCNVAATTDMSNQAAVMKKAYGPLVKQCGKLLEQKPDASLEVYLLFSGLWWDAESYSLQDVIPIFEEGIARYPESAQLHFNVSSTYFTEANNAYFAQRFADVIQYIHLGMNHIEKARTLDQKLVLGAESHLRAMRHRCKVAEKQLKQSSWN